MARTTTAVRSRRNILGLGGAAAAALGLATMATRPADASAGDALKLGAVNNDADDQPTAAKAAVDGPGVAFTFTNTTGSGPALLASSSDVGGTPGGHPIGALIGDSETGWATIGRTTSGIGVFGAAESGDGIGVQGWGPTGVKAIGDNYALDVEGANRFTQAGTATVAAGTSAKTVGGLKVGTGALVLATVQGAPASVTVASAKRVSATKIRIFLTGNAPAGGVKVGFFVLN